MPHEGVLTLHLKTLLLIPLVPTAPCVHAQDEAGQQFAVVVDRAQSVASLASGQLEFLLHFRSALRQLARIQRSKAVSHAAFAVWHLHSHMCRVCRAA